MPRLLRLYLIACIAVALGYLVWHAGEPLRLNVGDTWTDANVLTRLGTQAITVLRLLALAVSALAIWLLFQYVRRIFNDTVALITAGLWATSLLSLMFADSLQRSPIMHASCFLALWGVVRALETGSWRHHVAVLV